MPGSQRFIGVDAGTSACKTVLVDELLRVRATAWRPYPTRRLPDGTVTQNADHWLAAVAATLGELARACDPSSVGAVSVTAPAHNVVLVDDHGDPLAPVILWSDTRSEGVATELAADLGELLLERAFVSLGPSWTLPQLAWLHRARPELWPTVRGVLPGKDFIRYRMTGDRATDPSDAAGTAMYDQMEGCWLEPAVEATRLTADVLPQIRPSSSPGGGLTAEWAALTGLPEGTPVAVGATDTAAELLAVGAVDADASLVKIASAGTVVAVSRDPRPDHRVLTYPHTLPGRWYTVAATNTAATAYTWLRSALFESGAAKPSALYGAMDRIASQVEPGAGGMLFLPFLEGERCPHWDPRLRAAFIGLTSSHARPHLCRAVLEGVAMSLRSCRDLLEDLGLRVREPRLAGGGVASAVWRDILVSVLGEQGWLIDPQGPAVGAAMLAATSVGAIDESTELPEQSATPVEIRAEWSKTYDCQYKIYRRACAAVARIDHDLDTLARELQMANAGGPR